MQKSCGGEVLSATQEQLGYSILSGVPAGESVGEESESSRAPSCKPCQANY